MTQLLNTWLFWRLSGLVTWAWIVLTIWSIFIPKSVPSHVIWGIVYPLGVGAFLLINNRVGRACIYGLYLVFFPIVCAALALQGVYHRFNGICRIFNQVSSPYLSPIYLSLIIVASLFLATLESDRWIQIVSGTILLINSLLIGNALRWAINPIKPIDAIAQLLHTICVQFKGKTKDEQTPEQIKKGMENLRTVYEFVGPILNKLEKQVASTITAAFILYFCFLFWVTALSFTSVYLSLASLGELHYRGLTSNFYECLLYSISVLTTSPYSGSEPISTFAKSVYCLELLSTVALITLFVSIFAVGFGMQDGSIESIKQISSKIREHFDSELQIYNGLTTQTLVGEAAEMPHSSSLSQPAVLTPQPIVKSVPPLPEVAPDAPSTPKPKRSNSRSRRGGKS